MYRRVWGLILLRFSVPQRMFIHHRSESVPYVYEHPHFGYPVAHSIDYPVAPSSKHLVIVSFIGLLLLFAIIQNTIATVKRREMLTDVLSARKKRELYAAYDFNSAVRPFRLHEIKPCIHCSGYKKRVGNFRVLHVQPRAKDT